MDILGNILLELLSLGQVSQTMRSTLRYQTMTGYIQFMEMVQMSMKVGKNTQSHLVTQLELVVSRIQVWNTVRLLASLLLALST